VGLALELGKVTFIYGVGYGFHVRFQVQHADHLAEELRITTIGLIDVVEVDGFGGVKLLELADNLML